jgi:hypothetical protein
MRDGRVDSEKYHQMLFQLVRLPTQGATSHPNASPDRHSAYCSTPPNTGRRPSQLLPQTASSLANPRRSKSMTSHRSRRRSNRGIEDGRAELALATEAATATALVFHGSAAHSWEDTESAQGFFRMGCSSTAPLRRFVGLYKSSPRK